jgi:hypothetical protein
MDPRLFAAVGTEADPQMRRIKEAAELTEVHTTTSSYSWTAVTLTA